jgi:hypothetical protein
MDMTPYSPLIVNGGKCRLHFLGQEEAKQKTSVKQVANGACDMLLRNVD